MVNRKKPLTKVTIEIGKAKLAHVKEARERSIKRLQEMDGLDLDNETVMNSAWRR